MKISVVVAYHGEEIYIYDCLDSLAEQTYRDFEVILICDGCRKPDIEKYSDMNIHIVSQETTGGVAASRNLGIEKAEGDYVYFLDADDYIDKETFENLVELAVPDSIVYGRHKETWYSRAVQNDNGDELARQRIDPNEDVEAKNPCQYFFMRAEKLQNITVLGMLIPRGAILDHQIKFSEQLHYFSDLPFLTALLTKLDRLLLCEKSFYYKRQHNDPINLPSLLQENDEEKKIFEGMNAYEMSKKQLHEDAQAGNIGCFENKDLEMYFDYKFTRFLAAEIASFMIEANQKTRQSIAGCLRTALEYLGSDVYKIVERHSKALIQCGKNGDYNKIAKKTRNRARRQTLFRVCTSRAQLKRYLYRKVFSRMKMLDNTVIFESFFGKSYSDSPKYIFEYLNENYPGKYNYIWINAGNKLHLSYPAKQIKRFSFQYFYYMARCKYIVFNGRQPKYFIKRKGNVFLETWHGTPLKKLVFDMDDVTAATPLYKEHFYIQKSSWDYLVAPNKFSEDIFRRAFMYDGEMLETGYPRNDILYHPKKEQLTREIKDELGIPQNKKIILYAPTWRDDEFYESGRYKFTLQLDLGKMREKLDKDYVVILRTHYFIADSIDISEYGGFVFNLSKYDDIARLYLISDILITDYSSVFFDYANLRRPMLFFTYDLEKYRSVLRGFYMDVEEELPGPMLFDTNEIIQAVENIAGIEKQYADKYDKFCKKYCEWENGHATEKIVNTVFNDKK